MLKAVAAISLGASVGALARWLLGLRLNSLLPWIPPGTLAANLIGGYVIGVAVAFFSETPDIAPEWRLLIVTGFCGGLTTFSTFSAEVVSLLQQRDLGHAFTAIVVHVMGSLAMTLVGIASFHWISR